MTQKRSYKVLAAIPRRDGSGDWFMKVGSGFTNRDDSINLYIDALPTGTSGNRGMILQIRELDANDLAKRDAYRATADAARRGQDPAATALPGAASEGLPF